MRYYDCSSNELVGKLTAEPPDLGEVNRSGIRWTTKLFVITRTDHLEVVHSVLRGGHRAIDRARIISAKSEIRPEGCAKEADSADNGTPRIEHIDSQASPLHKQLLRHIVYVLSVKLMITSDIHNRDRGKLRRAHSMPLTPL